MNHFCSSLDKRFLLTKLDVFHAIFWSKIFPKTSVHVKCVPISKSGSVYCSALQCSTIQCSSVQCSEGQSSAIVQCHTVQYSVVQCYLLQFNVAHRALFCLSLIRVDSPSNFFARKLLSELVASKSLSWSRVRA